MTWTTRHKKPDDTQVEQTMGNLLRAGVILAAVGDGRSAAPFIWPSAGGSRPDTATFHGGSAGELNSVPGVVGFAFGGRGRADPARGCCC